jgi:hypothetical protein
MVTLSLSRWNPSILKFNTTICAWKVGWKPGSLLNAGWYQHCGSKPRCHIHSIHMKGVWRHSNAVNGGDIDTSSCHYHHTCWFRLFGLSAKILGHCLVPNEAIVQWLKLQTRMKWLPQHPLHTYERCLTTFICCGWDYGSIMMTLPPHLPVPIWIAGWNPGSLLGAKWSHCAVVGAPNPHLMATISTPYIWKVFDNIHMLWMGIWIHHDDIVTTTLVGSDLDSRLKSWVTAWR